MVLKIKFHHRSTPGCEHLQHTLVLGTLTLKPRMSPSLPCAHEGPQKSLPAPRTAYDSVSAAGDSVLSRALADMGQVAVNKLVAWVEWKMFIFSSWKISV